MLSDMESSEFPTDPAEARVALAEAQAARNRMSGNLALPSFFYSSIGAGIAVEIATTAYAIGLNDVAGMVSFFGGVAAFVLVGIVQLARFRRLNGVWVSGLASQVVLGTSNLTSAVYVAASFVSVWAAFTGVWWLVPVAAILGGVAYAWCARRWWRSYQENPMRRWQQDSKAFVIILPVLATAGLVLLLVWR